MRWSGAVRSEGSRAPEPGTVGQPGGPPTVRDLREWMAGEERFLAGPRPWDRVRTEVSAMRMPRTRDVISIAVAPLLLGVPLAAASPARAASTCEAWTGVQPPNPGGATRPNLLAAAAVLSPCTAWAVGNYS